MLDVKAFHFFNITYKQFQWFMFYVVINTTLAVSKGWNGLTVYTKVFWKRDVKPNQSRK